MNDTSPFTPPESESLPNATSNDVDVNAPTLVQRICKPAIITTAIVTILAGLSLCATFDSIFGVAFIFPFSLGPLAITGLFGFMLAGQISQWILASSSICYGVWFLFMYVACNNSPSSTAGLGFLVIGLYSLPVLFFFWIAAWAVHLESISDRGQ